MGLESRGKGAIDPEAKRVTTDGDNEFSSVVYGDARGGPAGYLTVSVLQPAGVLCLLPARSVA